MKAAANIWGCTMLGVTPFHYLGADGTPVCSASGPLTGRDWDDTDPDPPGIYRCSWCVRRLTETVPA